MRRRFVAFVSVGVLVLATGVFLHGPAMATGAAASCVIDSSAPPGGTFDEDGIPSYQKWLMTPEAEAALEAIGDELEKETGAEPGSPDGLPSGLIGIAVDNVSQTVFVVIDPVLFPDAAGLQQRLQDIASTAFPVAVSASCNSAADLLKARVILDAASWDAAAAQVPHAWGVDPYTSTWNVTFDPSASQTQAVADALAADLGPLVTIDWAPLLLHGRYNDGEPHYGAAAIRPGSESGNVCTSGPVVVIVSNGQTGSVTAGHCFKLTG